MSKDLFFESRSQEISGLVNSVKNGEKRALIAYATLKRYNDLINNGLNQIKDLALDEAKLYGTNNFNENGFNFEYRNGSTRYSYKNIAIWNEKNKELKEIEQKAKHAFLSKQKNMIISDENGEVIELPDITYTPDVLIVKK